MVIFNIVVAIFCAVLLVFFTYKHCGKRGHDRQEGSNRESSGGGNLFTKSNGEGWIGELLCYFDEQCEKRELKLGTFSRIHARIVFINSKTAFGRIKKSLEDTTESDEAYCWGIVYGYCCRKSCEGGCPDELSGILQDGLKGDFDRGFNKGMEIFAPDNNTTSRARF